MQRQEVTTTFYLLLVTTLFALILLPIVMQAQEAKKKIMVNGKVVTHIPRQKNLEKSDGCEPEEFRTIDGTCNNADQPEWGAADIQLHRSMDSDYWASDYYNDMSGQDRLSPRAISNMVNAQSEDIPSDFNLSSFVFTWGQFLDHDIDLTPEGHTEFHPISMPDDEPLFTSDIPFFRSAVHEGTGVEDYRQQTNLITSWIDASNVYGSEQSRADWLRTFEDGKLKTSAGNLLPYNTLDGEYDSAIDPTAPSMAGDDDGASKTFVAGDVRAAEQPGLTSLHTLFVREHNRICEKLVEKGMTDDEEIYQTARKEVGGLMQSITFREFLPALGIKLPKYNGYKPNTQPDIMNMFATAAYRLGHTMVTEELLLVDDQCDPVDDGSLTLLEAFFNPTVLGTYGIDPILKGLAIQVQQEVDAHIIDNLRNFLFAIPGAGTFGLDLASLNIQRGRDHGLPDYNTIRSHYTGDPISSFDDITNVDEVSDALSEAYDGDIDNIDAWVGMLAEKHLNGKSVGKTLHEVLKSQFSKLRDGDFYYYEHDPYLSKKERDRIKHTQLSEVIERNTDIDVLQHNVFYAKSCESLGSGGHGGGHGGGHHDDHGGGRKTDESTSLLTNGSFSLYPNPSSNFVQLSLNATDLQEAVIQIVDIQGRLVWNKTLTNLNGNYQQQYDFQHLDRGLYILSIQTNEGQYTEKLILQ